MRPAALLLALLLAAPIAHAQASFLPTGDLHLRTDGTLAPQPGDAAQACLALQGPTGAAQAATFAAPLAEGAYTVSQANLTLLVALGGSNGAAQSGAGFTLAAELAFGTNEPLRAQQDVAPAQSPTGLTLTFPLDADVQAEGPLNLTLFLSPAAGPLPGVGRDVQVLCDHEETKLASFNLQGSLLLPPGDGHEDEEEHGLALPGPVVFLISLLAGAATLAAGLLALAGRTISERRVHLLLGITAGLLLAIALIDLVPEAVELEENAVFTLAFGVLGLFIIKWVSGSHAHAHADHEGHTHAHTPRSGATRLALLAFFALAFHRLVDGIVLPASFEVGGATGLAAAGAILAHQFPDGIAGASVFLAAGWARKKVMLGVLVLALLTPVGALVGLTFLGLSGLIGHLIALAAATFIFIALAELLPELQTPKYRGVVAVGVVLGYAGALALEFIAGLVGGH